MASVIRSRIVLHACVSMCVLFVTSQAVDAQFDKVFKKSFRDIHKAAREASKKIKKTSKSLFKSPPEEAPRLRAEPATIRVLNKTKQVLLVSLYYRNTAGVWKRKRNVRVASGSIVSLARTKNATAYIYVEKDNVKQRTARAPKPTVGESKAYEHFKKLKSDAENAAARLRKEIKPARGAVFQLKGRLNGGYLAFGVLVVDDAFLEKDHLGAKSDRVYRLVTDE